jgi:hypothetical protein
VEAAKPAAKPVVERRKATRPWSGKPAAEKKPLERGEEKAWKEF